MDDDDTGDVWAQLAADWTACYWCGRPAEGTAPDHNGVPRYTCGLPGHAGAG